MPKFISNRVRTQVGNTLAPRTRRSGSGQVDSLWRGVFTADAVDFIAVGGGGGGGGGNWTNGVYGAGGGGGGLAAGTLSSPSSGTITVAAADGTSVCFGESAYPGIGAGGAGGGRTTTGGGNGGAGGGNNGPTSSITGTLTYYGGGGGNSSFNSSPPGGLGGGGGGMNWNGANPIGPFGGAPNTGGGGGGSAFGNGAGGGSGIVILRYADSFPEISSISVGLTYTYTVSGGFRRYTFTAGTGTVTF